MLLTGSGLPTVENICDLLTKDCADDTARGDILILSICSLWMSRLALADVSRAKIVEGEMKRQISESPLRSSKSSAAALDPLLHRTC